MNENSQLVKTKQMKNPVLLLVLSFLLATCNFAQDSISVLFIGNSYVYTNDLPGVLSQLASNLGKTVTVGSKVNGGYTFQAHVNDPQTYSAIHQRSWDVVVLQGQSQEPSFPFSQVTSNSLPYAIQLADSVKAANFCSNVQFFMTWGRQNGDQQWDSINTFDKMNRRLYDAYMRFADSVDAMVSPVGAVWKYVRDNHPTIQLYVSDGSHPSPAGTYLAACTFYSSLFRSSPLGSTYFGGLDPTTAEILQAASAQILDSLEQFNLHPVNQPTQANFDFSVNGPTVQFTSMSSFATDWYWQFGDGITDVVEHPMHAYNSNGLFEVQLVASSVCNTDTLVQQVEMTTLNMNENDNDFSIKEYPSYFVLKTNKPILYEIYTIDGKKIQNEQMLTAGNHQFTKVGEAGVLVLKKSQDNMLKFRYVKH